jgi:glycosyltransferase involved in cell wall biosynthesis
VIEAAANARPVVASGSQTGAEILVPRRTGLLVPVGSPDELAAALGSLLVDPGLRRRMGEAAYALARDRFDPARNARTVGAIYASLLGGEPPAPRPEPERELVAAG